MRFFIFIAFLLYSGIAHAYEMGDPVEIIIIMPVTPSICDPVAEDCGVVVTQYPPVLSQTDTDTDPVDAQSQIQAWRAIKE